MLNQAILVFFFSLKNKKKPIPDKIKLDGNDLARVDAFSRFFQSVYKDHNDCIIPDCYTSILPRSPDDSLSLIQVAIDEVSKLLKALNIYKATGPDKLPNVILKKCVDALALSLTTFINFGLLSGLHPTQWKCANFAPVHNKNDKDQVSNYRHVSLLPVVYKIQENCVASRLVPFIKDSIYSLQHGFQSRKSCTSQLLQVIHEIGQALDKGLESDLIYFNFEKAFETKVLRYLRPLVKVV